MHKIIVSLFLATLAVLASADITVLYPSSQYWLVAETPQQVQWTFTGIAPQQFSMYLNNKNLSVFNFALSSGVVMNDKNRNVVVTLSPNNYDQGGYYITFANIGNISDVYATSENFVLKKPGSTSSVYSPSTSAPPSSTSSPSSTSTKSGGTNVIIINTYNTFLLMLCGLIALVLIN